MTDQPPSAGPSSSDAGPRWPGDVPATPPAVAPTPSTGPTSAGFPDATPTPGLPGRPERPRTRKAALFGGVAILAGVIGTIGWKILVGTVAVGIVGGTLSSFFGGPWDKLPADVRTSYQSRLETAVGKRLEGLSDQAASAQFETWLHGGFVRLGDAKLIRHLQLEIAALNRAAEKDCATFGRESVGGKSVDDDTAKALVAALDQPGMVELIGLNVDAIEAELRGSPAQVRADQTEGGSIIRRMLAQLSPAQLTSLTAIGSGQTVSDRDACDAVRGLYGQSTSLDQGSLATLARIDVDGQ
jgi:hypothetical protein